MKCFCALAAVVAVASVSAAPVEVPVAAGFPAWTGLTEKNRFNPDAKTVFQMRMPEAVDLRQKVVVVVEFDLDKAVEQLPKVPNLSQQFPPYTLGHGGGWCEYKRNRFVECIYINRSADRKGEKFLEALAKSDPKDLKSFSRQVGEPVIFHDVSYPGAPDTEGKRPYVYVLGPGGSTPIYEGAADGAKTLQAIRDAIAAAKKDLPEWQDFYGYVGESQFFPSLKKTVEAGKPLKAEVAKLVKGIKSTDAAQATEAQKLYDAVLQTRNEFLYRISLAATAAPYQAIYEATVLSRYWPEEKKRTAAMLKTAMANANYVFIGNALVKYMPWKQPGFEPKNAGETKKILAEIAKLRKGLKPMKDQSNNIPVQNAALLTDAELEELEETMKARLSVAK